ncbi:MAG: Ig-like domain-containing protein [Taibaiella sp.]|nr:Ig-like domain-containing protein [Taibaiella sp.]
MSGRIFIYILLCGVLASGCANISAPTGGKKDVKPPKLVSVSPADSLLNVRSTEIVLRFDEYVTLADAAKEVIVSPILRVPATVTGINKHVTVRIPDSLLEENTTYRITFGSAIRDLHEGNIFPKYAYTFSTGNWFDSLQYSGKVLNAATGLPDSSALVMLYKEQEDDTAVIRKKPQYAVRADRQGVFHFRGLPGRRFKIYALADGNNNMIYDGGTEMIAFGDSIALPVDTANFALTLRVFPEISDTAKSVAKEKPSKQRKILKSLPDTALTFKVNLDTSDTNKRTFDGSDSIKFVFNHRISAGGGSVHLSYDSAGKAATIPTKIRYDLADSTKVLISARFADNKLYTLSVDSSLVVDTGGLRNSPLRYKFRTLGPSDYGSLKLNVPSKYMSTGKPGEPDYLLMVQTASDTLYQQKVVDTAVFFPRLKPAGYTFRIIVDRNKDGKWTTGDLLLKRQPELVIPASNTLDIKAGFDNIFDFEMPPKPSMGKGLRGKTPSKK